MSMTKFFAILFGGSAGVIVAAASLHALHSPEAEVPRSYYPALDQFTDTDEKLIRWLDTDTGVICYARSRGASNTLSCIALRAQRMP